MDEEDLKKIFANPFYAINFDEGLFGEHEPMVSEEDWIRTNLRLMEDFGKEEWLLRLLKVLQGDYPRGVSEGDSIGYLKGGELQNGK